MEHRDGSQVVRLKILPPPCEKPHQGCPKGHWSKPIELRAGDRRLVELYEASVATGGAILTEAERRDDILLFVFSLLSIHYEHSRQVSFATSIRAAIASIPR